MINANLRPTVTAVVLALAVTSGCTDDFTGINENPNAPTDVASRYLLPTVITSAVTNLLGTGLDRGVASLWVQHYASLQYTGTDRYIIEPSFSDGYWRNLYRGPIVDVNDIIDRANEQGTVNDAAVGMILRAW
ncbi:MAG TPA: SusD/RagB family nutrient-binding outer membrane lipoprotein, partial [Longimicrobiales bacterium]|nr:SusD/RagB family nutrient-binding outer membrane lipoprotein [Longimicrobiales bacterium]